VGRFELDRYLRASRKLDLDGIDFDDVARYPVSTAERRILTYMMDIETHTVIYLRDLLSTAAAQDPEVTAFLSMWVYEEFWHGEALGKFLEAAGERFDPGRVAAIRRGGGESIVTKAIKSLAAHFVPDFVALHMTWGAINELSTLHGYQQVIARTNHPILRELLTRIIKDERRHYAFYYNQARVRLDANPRSQRFVRWALDRFWAPVGTGVRPQVETDLVITTLFGDEAGLSAIVEMEEDLSKLPGLHGMRLLRRARTHALRRAPRIVTGRARLPIAAHV
jgi:hypothetical protein